MDDAVCRMLGLTRRECSRWCGFAVGHVAFAASFMATGVLAGNVTSALFFALLLPWCVWQARLVALDPDLAGWPDPPNSVAVALGAAAGVVAGGAFTVLALAGDALARGFTGG